MADFTNEIKKRRTFAIISHPDAGKTINLDKTYIYDIIYAQERSCFSGRFKMKRVDLKD